MILQQQDLNMPMQTMKITLKNKFMKSSQREGQGGKKGGETVTRK